MYPDEKHLLIELSAGSADSFQKLYEQWVPRLYSFVYRYVKSEDVTDDIVQETFLRVWTNRQGLNPSCSFKSYLFTIAYHLLLKELRRQLNNPSMEDYVEYEYQMGTSGEYIERHIDFEHFQAKLAKAKAKLTPRQREIFELNKEQGLSAADIVARLSITEQVVRNQLSASLKVIRTELQPYAGLLTLFFLLNNM